MKKAETKSSMTPLEKAARKYRRRMKIQDYALLTLYGTAGLTLALMAPNAAQLLKHIDVNFERKRNVTYRMQQALKRLETRGLVQRNEKHAGARFVLTAKGERLAEKLSLRERLFNPPRPPRWDGMWRVVIFDIWEKRRDVRDRLRAMLSQIGFIKIQNSVWIFPYDCEELIVFIRTELKLGPSVTYLIAQGIERDLPYRKHFGLPLK